MRTFLLIVVSILGVVSVSAQDMKSVFIAMPDSIIPLLTKVNREDCVDFLASNMKAEVTNRFGGTAEMKELTEDYVRMQMTSNSTLEMKLFPINDSIKVVCMVKTVCALACDSDISFYVSDWSEELDARAFIQLPKSDEFFLPSDTLSEEDIWIRRKADMHLVKASLSKDDTSLTFIYTTPDYLNKEDKEKILPHLRKEPVVLQWQDGKFN